MHSGTDAVVAEGVSFGGGFPLYGVAVVVVDVEYRTALGAPGFLQLGVDGDAYVALHFYGACEVVGLGIAVDVGDEEHAAEACLGEGGPGEVGGGAGLFDEVFVLASAGYAVYVPIGLREELDIYGVGRDAVVDVLTRSEEQRKEQGDSVFEFEIWHGRRDYWMPRRALKARW